MACSELANVIIGRINVLGFKSSTSSFITLNSKFLIHNFLCIFVPHLGLLGIDRVDDLDVSMQGVVESSL